MIEPTDHDHRDLPLLLAGLGLADPDDVSDPGGTDLPVVLEDGSGSLDREAHGQEGR